MFHQRRAYLEFIVVTVLALMLYLPFRSIRWDLNGIIEAQAINSGWAGLFSPNHLLFRPLGFAVLALVHSFGYHGFSVEILQFITGIMAAIEIGLFWLWIKVETDNVLVASVVSAFLATTWSQWTFSTDIYYITPAAALIAGALVVLSSRSDQTHKANVKLGLLVALAILFWQANIFIFLIIILSLLWTHRENSLNKVLIGTVVFMLIACGIVGLTYLIAGIQVNKLSSVRDFTGWMLSHSSEGTVSLWGKWSIDRFPAAVKSALSSFVPFWEGLGLRDILRGDFRSDKLLAQLSLVAFVFLGIITVIGVVRKWEAIKPIQNKIILLGLSYFAYTLFIVWWDPYEPKWFVIPNLFIVAILAQIWSILFNDWWRFILIGACILVIAVANFTYTIWPRHSLPNPNVQLAQCFATNATDKDTVLITDWNWFDYAEYFFDYRGNHLYLYGVSADKPSKIELIKDSVLETNKQGGHVFMRDLDTYSLEQLPFVELLTGLTPTDFDVFEQNDAFSCNGSRFLEIVELK